MTWDGFSCILGFQNFTGGAPTPPPPPTTLQEEIHGESLDFIRLSNLRATPHPPSRSHIMETSPNKNNPRFASNL